MMDDERRVERPMMAGKDDMTTETTKARPLLVRSDELLECPFCGGRPRQYITGSEQHGFRRGRARCETKGCWLYHKGCDLDEWQARHPNGKDDRT